MKPIQTHYKGYHFRSRLEARVAVYLDAIGWTWDYEPEGYDLDGLLYLPDFLIRWPAEGGGKLWLEVKAEEPEPDEHMKARLLAQHTQISVAFMIGTPDPAKTVYGLDGYHIFPDAGVCWTPNMVSLGHYCMTKWGRPGWLMYDEDITTDDRRACYAARSARFEHGESGATGVWVPAHG